MDGAIVFLLIFVCFCVLQGVSLARVHGLSRELDGLKQAVGMISDVQREGAAAHKTDDVSPQVISGLLENPDVLKAFVEMGHNG